MVAAMPRGRHCEASGCERDRQEMLSNAQGRTDGRTDGMSDGWGFGTRIGRAGGWASGWSNGGRAAGRAVGRPGAVGQPDGRTVGRSVGRSHGRTVGRSDGLTDGRTAVLAFGRVVGRTGGRRSDQTPGSRMVAHGQVVGRRPGGRSPGGRAAGRPGGLVLGKSALATLGVLGRAGDLGLGSLRRRRSLRSGWPRAALRDVCRRKAAELSSGSVVAESVHPLPNAVKLPYVFIYIEAVKP